MNLTRGQAAAALWITLFGGGIGCQSTPDAQEEAPTQDIGSPTPEEEDTTIPSRPEVTDAFAPEQSATCDMVELLDITDWTEPRGFVIAGDVSLSDTGAQLTPIEAAARLELPIMPVTTSLQLSIDFEIESGTLHAYFRGAANSGSRVGAGLATSLTLQGNPSDAG